MGRISRRRFLEDSMFAAAAAVGTANAGNKLWAAEAGKKVGPNDQIRLAVIGIHGRGRSHIRSFAKMDDVTVAVLCDPDSNLFADRIKMVEEKGDKTPKCVQDLRRVMDDESIDAVSIATPNHWHTLAAIWAIQAGKDVYLEKPVSHNISEGRRVVQTARKYRRICQTGTQCRSYKGTQDAIEYVHAGKIGKVEVARGLCYKRRKSIGLVSGDQPVPKGVDYNLWLGPAPMKPIRRTQFHYDWHWQWDYGNGDLGNQGIHQMDIARWGLNKNGLARSVIGVGGRFGYKDDGQTPNTHLTFLDYGDGQLIFEVRGLETKPLRGAGVGVIFHGTEGYVVMTGYTKGAAFDLNGKKVAEFTGGGDHMRNFIDAMRSRKHTDLTADILEGHLSSASCHLGNVSYLLGEDQPFNKKTKAFGDNKEAYATLERFEKHLEANGVPVDSAMYRLGRKLTVDAKTETFTNDSEANELVTREYRAPFVVPPVV